MKTLVIVCLALCLSSSAAAQDSLNVSLLTSLHTGWDSAEDMEVVGNYAYVATGHSGMRILDVSDPNNPDIIGTCDTPGDALRIDVQGDYAYIADYSAGTRVIDISDPYAPVEVGYYPPNIHTDIAVQGEYAYAAIPFGDQLYIINISDPTSPQLISQVNNVKAEWVVVEGNYAYVAGSMHGSDEVTVIDISDPTQPTEVVTCTITGDAADINYVDGFVYVTTNTHLLVVEVDLPQLNVVGQCNLTNLGHGVRVAGDYAYVAQDTHGLGIFDVSDPTDPVHVSTSVVDSWGYGVDVVDNTVYLASRNEFITYDVGNPGLPDVLSVVQSFGMLNDISLQNDIVCMATSQNRIVLYDVQNPDQPEFLGNSNYLSGSPYQIVRQGDLVYSVSFNTLSIHDISNPNQPQSVGSVTFNDCFGYSLAVSGNFAYVGDYGGGIQIVEITDPEAPVERGSCDGPMESHGIALRGSYACVATYMGGLRIIDISDPDNPFEASFHDLNAHAYDVVIDGNYAFVATDDSGVLVFDISDPLNPTTVGVCSTNSYAHGVELVDDHLYIATDANLQVYDVSDPENPVETGYYSTNESCDNVAFLDGTAWVVSGYQLLGMDVSLAAPPSPVVITLSATAPLFVPRGGIIEYGAILTSNLPSPYAVDIWTYVDLPSGDPYGPIWRIINFPFTPNTVIRADALGQSIPNDAYLGSYTFHMNAGLFPHTVVGEDEFTFEVIDAPGTVASGDQNWSAWGYESAFLTDQFIAQSDRFIPAEYSLSKAYPNPFNEMTTVTVALPESSNLTVTVFNTLGQQVAELASGRVNAGTQTLTFDASDLSSGIYFIQATVPGKLDSMQKVVLVK
jgi:hypothetical protein